MQVEYGIHQVSSKLKLILFETLQSPSSFKTDSQYLHDFTRPGCFLRIKNGQAQLFLVDDEFKTIKHTYTMTPLWHVSCWSLISGIQISMVVLCSKNVISLIQINTDGTTKIRDKIQLNMKSWDQIIFLSNSIDLKNCRLFIAYSKSNQFYLVVIKSTGQLSVTKLSITNDIDHKQGWFNWLGQRNTNYYSFIDLYLLRMDKYQRFLKLLVIRDNNVSLHMIQLHLSSQHSILSLLQSANDLISLLPKGSKIKQSSIRHHISNQFRDLDIFLTIQDQSNTISIIKIHADSLNKIFFSSSKLICQLPNKQFSMTYFNDYIYYSYYNTKQNRYQIIRNKVCWIQQKQHLIFLDQHPFVICDYKPIFRKSTEKLYMIERSLVYAVQVDQQESDFSYQQRRWIAFKDDITKIYAKKIKALSNSRVIDLILLLNQKEKKIAVWLKKEGNFLEEQQTQVIQILGLEIVQIIVLRVIAYEFYRMANSVSKRQLGFTQQQLFEAAASGQVSDIILLLNQIASHMDVQLFLKILYQLKNLRVQSYYEQAVKTIFEEPFRVFTQQFIQQNISEVSYQKVLEEIARLRLVEVNHLNYFINKGRDRFVRQLIITNKLEDLFIEFFISHGKFRFTDDNLRFLLLLLKQESDHKFISFFRSLLKRCKQQQQKDNNFLYERLGVLIDGLIPYHEDIYAEIDLIIPGLNFFLYMKRGNRRKIIYILGTNPHFQELKNKNLLQLFVEDVLKTDTKLDSHLSILYDAIFKNNAINGPQILNQMKRRRQNDRREAIGLQPFENYPNKKKKL